MTGFDETPPPSWQEIAEGLANQLQELREELATARTLANATINEWRPVITAAKAWRAQFSNSADTKLPRMWALIEAVDNLTADGGAS
jgi:hypothetical protein